MRSARAAKRLLAGRRLRGTRRVLAAVGAAAGLAGLVTACGPASGATSGGTPGSTDKTTVTYAMAPGSQATYAFPFISLNHSVAGSIYNVNDFQNLMYRPLYWFGSGVNPYINQSLSLAYPPTYSGNTVTIRLKQNYKWSNGENVNAQDVVFWMNMMIAENVPGNPNEWDFTTPGGLPSDITDVRATDTYTVTMKITTPQFSQTWFTNNELSQITPMPLAWDVTGANQQPGSGHCATTISACKAVYTYLDKQSTDTASYATSPLWSVVDGPWKMQSFQNPGNVTLVFNDKYSGPVPPHHITKFVEVPFTTEAAEFNVLQDPTGSQAIDVGYLPTVDAPVPPAGSNVGANPPSLSGYALSAVYPWGINYFPYNFNNTTGQGAIFKQLYFRQAFQELVDQEGVINGPMHGYGKPGTGPVADYPVTNYLSPAIARQGDAWTLNIPAARATLMDHGWKQPQGSNGPMTCVNPGSGPHQCGPGVRAGIALSFTLVYATGIDYMESAARELESNASQAGISITLQPKLFSDVINIAFNVPPTNPHTWQLAEWGGWTYAPDYLPTGEALFSTTAPNNGGGYSNAQNDALITKTLEDRSPRQFTTDMYKWQNFLANQLPVVYTPINPSLVEAIKGLDIGPQNSADMITPELWFYR